MLLTDALLYQFSQIREGVHRAADGLDSAALRWRPDQGANSIAWLVWHLARVADSHVLEIAERDELWAAEGWAPRFGLPDDYTDSGYGHGPDDVARIAPADGAVLTAYADRVFDVVDEIVGGMGSDDFARVIDERWDPPVTAVVRLMSVQGDALQHVGQAAYLRGLYERGDVSRP